MKLLIAVLTLCALFAEDQIFWCCFEDGTASLDDDALCYTSFWPDECPWGFWVDGEYPDWCEELCPPLGCDDSGTCTDRNSDSVCNFECPPPIYFDEEG